MNTEELKKYALAATPGPWRAAISSSMVNRVCTTFETVCETGKNIDDALYIAAANPVAILALIAERDELLAALKESQSVNFWVSCQCNVVEKCMCAGCIEDRVQEVIAKAEG